MITSQASRVSVKAESNIEINAMRYEADLVAWQNVTVTIKAAPDYFLAAFPPKIHTYMCMKGQR